jgi:hypothetical protein
MWLNSETILATYSVIAAHPRTASADSPHFEVAIFLSFVTAFLTVVCFIEQRRHRWVRLALGVLFLLNAGFGIAAGAWPLGTLQIVWAGYTFSRWWSPINKNSPTKPTSQFQIRHRMSQSYGLNALNN